MTRHTDLPNSGTSGVGLDDKIRHLMDRLDEATPPPPPFHELHHTVREPSRLVPMVAAAVLVVVGIGGIVAVSSRNRSQAPTNAASSPTQTAPGVHWETPTVRLDAASVEVVTGDRTWVPTDDVVVWGDPGRINQFTTLELTWHDGGVEQRIHLYFASDGTDWWVSEIRTYDGEEEGGWIDPIAVGEFFKTPLGTAYVGDVDLPNLQIHDMTLEAFLPPSVCDAPTAPIALLADFPVIDGPDARIGGYGTTFQLIDTATCTPLPVAPYEFEYVSDDPTIVSVNASEEFEEFDDYPEEKAWVGLTLRAAGSTTVRATARDGDGNVVGTATMAVTIGPVPYATDPATTDDTVPASVSSSFPPATTDGFEAEYHHRVEPLVEHLDGLGYEITAVDTRNQPATIYARSTSDSRTLTITMNPGTMLVPENHDRVPIVVDEQTDTRVSGHVASNNGWTFVITADRTPTDGALPTTSELQTILYTLDP